jgi:hypothetical protein
MKLRNSQIGAEIHSPSNRLPPPGNGTEGKGDAGCEAEREAEASSGLSITVHHGIHSAPYPIAGLTVGQARRILSPLLNIDPGSVAVVRGHIIKDEDSRVLIARDEILNFVKESAIKGAARRSFP